MASNDGFTRRIPKNATRDVAEYAGAKKKQWKPMCFSRCFFLQLEAQSVKKKGEKTKKCKINAKVQTEMQPELQQSNDADTSCKKNAIGTGDCKKKRSNHQIAKKKAM